MALLRHGRYTGFERKAGGLAIISFRTTAFYLPDCSQNKITVSDTQHLLSDF